MTPDDPPPPAQVGYIGPGRHTAHLLSPCGQVARGGKRRTEASDRKGVVKTVAMLHLPPSMKPLTTAYSRAPVKTNYNTEGKRKGLKKKKKGSEKLKNKIFLYDDRVVAFYDSPFPSSD